MLASTPVGSQGMCMKNLVEIGSVVLAPFYVLTVCTKNRLKIWSKKVRWDSKKISARIPVGSQGMRMINLVEIGSVVLAPYELTVCTKKAIENSK